MLYQNYLLIVHVDQLSLYLNKTCMLCNECLWCRVSCKTAGMQAWQASGVATAARRTRFLTRKCAKLWHRRGRHLALSTSAAQICPSQRHRWLVIYFLIPSSENTVCFEIISKVRYNKISSIWLLWDHNW